MMNLDVKIAVDIGPQKKRAVVVDNFYKNPDEVRQLCLDSKKITPEDDPGMISSLPGNRVFIETEEVAEKLEKVFFMLCFDPDLWERNLLMWNFSIQNGISLVLCAM